MPAPSKVDRDGIVAQALALVDEHGSDGLTLAELAHALGIKAPSLYKRFRDRDALLSAVRSAAFSALGRSLARQARDMHTLARAYRSFARRRPHLYALLFAPGLPADPDEGAARRAAAEPLLRLLAASRASASPDDLLAIARVFTAFVHGYVSMELAGAFQLAPLDDAVFTAGIEALWRALVHDDGVERSS